jgi:hypothetical protein
MACATADLTSSIEGLSREIPGYNLGSESEGRHDLIKSKALHLTAALVMTVGGAALAQRPKENVSPGRHPNLAAAQRLSREAWQRVVDAQQANEWDMQGHAQKAKELLDQANNELKLAAEAANRK